MFYAHAHKTMLLLSIAVGKKKNISALATYILCLQEVPDLLLSALEKLN